MIAAFQAAFLIPSRTPSCEPGSGIGAFRALPRRPVARRWFAAGLNTNRGLRLVEMPLNLLVQTKDLFEGVADFADRGACADGFDEERHEIFGGTGGLFEAVQRLLHAVGVAF